MTFSMQADFLEDGLFFRLNHFFKETNEIKKVPTYIFRIVLLKRYS